MELACVAHSLRRSGVLPVGAARAATAKPRLRRKRDVAVAAYAPPAAGSARGNRLES
ncbi:hypothetical protein GLE_4568 [Lysobacter enzymogenes]|uniref:Uncharacterized protein n=1 Tax=Lysobacter enzymogenes TaxID=69 RepID=A0A0S2DN46_LYSEN|nr:hypothetical protein GLE_4568 [Lysobacter enzymogenes]